MNNKEFILHLTLIENVGPAVIQKILQSKRSDISISDLYSFSQADWIHTFGFSQGTAEKLVDGLASTKMVEAELTLIEQNDIQWMTFEENSYPYLLKQIYLPPAVIYVQGSLSVIHGIKSSRAHLDTSINSVVNTASSSPCAHPELVEGYPQAHQKLLAIVGARKADVYGYRVINQLIPELVAAHYTIVSGGALGIDAAAHEATIKSGGRTVAVLGSGLLQPYPLSNKKLFASIVEHGGTLVSSFPLRMEALPGHFPARNRIVTGLSHGCLVVQAAQKSGALISANYALEQGREVFAIPGPIDSELSAGCNTLIQNGAKLVMSTADILEEFGDRVILPDKKVMQEKVMQMSLESAVVDFSAARPECPVRDVSKGAKKDKYLQYSSQQKLIITACKEPISFDDIINATQFTPELLQTELFNLQLDGVISQDFTGMWVVCK